MHITSFQKRHYMGSAQSGDVIRTNFVLGAKFARVANFTKISQWLRRLYWITEYMDRRTEKLESIQNLILNRPEWWKVTLSQAIGCVAYFRRSLIFPCTALQGITMIVYRVCNIRINNSFIILFYSILNILISYFLIGITHGTRQYQLHFLFFHRKTRSFRNAIISERSQSLSIANVSSVCILLKTDTVRLICTLFPFHKFLILSCLYISNEKYTKFVWMHTPLQRT